MKRCTKCGKETPLDQIVPTTARCRPCVAVQKRAYYLANRERLRANQSAYHKAYNMANAERRKARAMEYKYGLTIEGYWAMVEAQGGVCALPSCDRSDLHVDHSHVTGIVRGLLCGRHNRALGSFGDEIPGIQEVLDYLKVHERPQSVLL